MIASGANGRQEMRRIKNDLASKNYHQRIIIKELLSKNYYQRIIINELLSTMNYGVVCDCVYSRAHFRPNNPHILKHRSRLVLKVYLNCPPVSGFCFFIPIIALIVFLRCIGGVVVVGFCRLFVDFL